ncbi:MAG: HepT-like ribonuclease domain-containing protein [Thermoplasmata archaeon]
MKAGREANEVYLSLAVEHLRNAVRYARRGHDVFFDSANPDTLLLVEGELRKAYESLNRLGKSFRIANPTVEWDRVGEIRQMLTHDYAEIDREAVWEMVTEDAPALLRRASRAKIPRSE